MAESSLSFDLTSSFRNTLMGRNLPPYNVSGAYSPPAGDVNYEVSPMNNYSVIDSPNDLIGTTVQANQLYPLNEYGPEGGYSNIISTDGAPLPVDSNKGEYGYQDADVTLVNEFFIDSAYIKNQYGPEGGYKDLVIVTDNFSDLQYFSPYASSNGSLFQSVPINFLYSVYSPYDILLSSNPTGNPGPLSQDSLLARIGAQELKTAFQQRISDEINQTLSSVINLDSLQDPFEASLVATGQQPLINKNWKITVPENPLLAAVSFANRLSGTYFPVSFIPGDYFTSPQQILSPQTENALNVVNNLTGGALGSVLNNSRNPSELFLANTGYGQKSVLFKSLDYNVFRPKYNKGLILGVTTAIENLLGANTDQGGGYYVGSDQAEPSTINSPANEVPVDRFGKQRQSPVYGPDTLGKLYEGNETKIKFGLGGKSMTNQGGITGQFTWVSPKYKDNLGFKVKPGGDPVQPQDAEFDAVKFEFNDDTESTGFDFKGGSILDNTQRLVESADGITGARRLQHVGNAINQVSKVFNDGYKEMTKGSQVIAYYDSVTNSETIGIDGMEVGREYCRVFQKDTPYFTYGDLQKTDGITTSGRRFHNSVFDNTFNLNIAPLRNPGSTNIFNQKVKKYMFSLENLAWRTSSEPGYTYDDLPVCERGPNGGRIMWFPPYNLSFNDSSTANWQPTSFLGRPEPIFTYKHTTRSGSIGWTIVVDHPAAMNTIVRKQLENMSPEQVDSIMNSFFAGCVKYDLYDLAAKFNTIPLNQLYEYQELLANPRLTDEEKYAILGEIPKNQEPSIGGADDGSSSTGNNTQNNTNSGTQGGNTTQGNDSATSNAQQMLSPFEGYAFYFDNDFPIGTSTNVTELPSDYFEWYNKYLARKTNYASATYAPAKVQSGADQFTRDAVIPFFDTVVIGNYDYIRKDFLQKLKEVVIDLQGSVTVDLQGSASAIATVNYNINLSSRRESVVVNWFKKQTLGDKKISDLITEGKIKFTFDPKGEGFTIPKSTNNNNVTVDCTKDIKDVAQGKVTVNAQIYSVPAMACRRVSIKKITVNSVIQPTPTPSPTPPPPPTPTPVDLTKKYKCVNGVCVEDVNGIFTGLTDCQNTCGDVPPPPQPTPIKPLDVPKKIKEGISKKVLRFLFSECDYFDILKESDPMVFATLKEKVKYFSPAFHSTTPEGLNARLTFLNQCVRPGQTIPVIGPDGNPKYNDARNTAFGTPPVLVLRIGDFYHTKIIPNQLQIQYEPLMLDINPEGIGIQPMLAKITLGFDFIGGHGLAEPVATLQNALSFNYYANTEIYDERAEATESTKDKDDALVAKIISRSETPPPPVQVTTAEVPEVQTQLGGSTIGKILSTNSFDNGNYEEGEIEYTAIFEELSTKTKDYFTTIFNQFKTINNVSNFGMLQIVQQEKKYFSGKLAQHDAAYVDTEIFGKAVKVENKIQNIIKAAIDDVKDNYNPIMAKVKANPLNFPDSAVRELRNKLISILQTRQDELNNALITPQNEMTKYQEGYVQVFRKLDLVYHKIDGYQLDTGKYKVYTLIDSGATQANSFQLIKENYQVKTGSILLDFLLLLKQKYITDPNVLDGETNYFPILEDKFGTDANIGPATRRFYFVMSTIFTDDSKFNPFVDSLITDLVKKNTFMEKDVRDECNRLKPIFVEEFDAEKKLMDDFEVSAEYQTYTNYKIEPFETKLSYTTEKQPNNNDNQKLIKQTYSEQNINNNNTFNDKITFN